MALRTFRSNPYLGGFGGGESSTAKSNVLFKYDTKGDGSRNRYGLADKPEKETIVQCDAFAQIIKELVDNAVDACSTSSAASRSLQKESDDFNQSIANKRVRVVLERFTPQDDGTCSFSRNRSTSHKENLVSIDDEQGISIFCNGDSGGNSIVANKSQSNGKKYSSRNDITYISHTQNVSANRNDGEEYEDELLRVTVTDNGCGMSNIQKCVSAFHSSKAGNTDNSTEDVTKSTETHQLTAGRYGIGLTLCLLHAQRLVPNSCASIKSATAASTHFTLESYVVDTKGDSVRCVRQEKLLKTYHRESGTAVSVLVPGGLTAQLAWPRLAEYFARFRLSLGIQCSLEVMAPTLSKVPLFVRPPHEQYQKLRRKMKSSMDTIVTKSIARSQLSTGLTEMEEEDSWTDVSCLFGCERNDSDYDRDANKKSDNSSKMTALGLQRTIKNYHIDRNINFDPNKAEDPRMGVLRAAQLYLGRPVELKNIAHSIEPIRIPTESTLAASTHFRNQEKVRHKIQSKQPQLEVDVVVYGPEDDREDENAENCLLPLNDILETNTNPASFPFTGIIEPIHDDDDKEVPSNLSNYQKERSTATMILVRMVNRIPLLDGTEASSCGLVRGITHSKRKLWNSFGLEVTGKEESAVGNFPPKMPVFEVRDSDQVVPFFQTTTHSLYEGEDEKSTCGSDVENIVTNADDAVEQSGSQRSYFSSNKGHKLSKWLRPAQVRLGNILVVVQIHANPSSLPLPTLSKGCLPIDNRYIDKALEIGLMRCLRSLQKTNPALLLTAQQLKKVERDVRYIPATSAAIASILGRSTNLNNREYHARCMEEWGIYHLAAQANKNFDKRCALMSTRYNNNIIELIESFGRIVETRFRQVIISQDEELRNKFLKLPGDKIGRGKRSTCKKDDYPKPAKKENIEFEDFIYSDEEEGMSASWSVSNNTKNEEPYTVNKRKNEAYLYGNLTQLDPRGIEENDARQKKKYRLSEKDVQKGDYYSWGGNNSKNDPNDQHCTEWENADDW